MHSAIYEGRVMHHRVWPKEHRFQYRVFYLWLDLDELEAVTRARWFFSVDRWNLFSIYNCDHFEVSEAPIKDKLFAWLALQGEDTTRVKRVRLLTLPRVLGYIFNPVCFFYGYGENEEPLWVVAEVTNTFHEKKPYLVGAMDEQGRLCRVTPKNFYVSPYSDLDLNFDFKLRSPEEKLEILINDKKGEQTVFFSTLSGRRRDLTDGRLLVCAVKYPLLTMQVIFFIHWEAAKLWWKGLPWRRKKANPELQTGLVRR